MSRTPKKTPEQVEAEKQRALEAANIRVRQRQEQRERDQHKGLLIPACVSRNWVNRLHVYSMGSGRFLCGRHCPLDARFWEADAQAIEEFKQPNPGYDKCKQCCSVLGVKP